MNHSIGLYFQFEIQEDSKALSLVRQSLRKIEQLEEAGIPIRYLELRAKKIPGAKADKEIWLKIDSDQRTYVGSDNAHDWEQAYIGTVKNIEERMLYEEADYARNSRLVELNIPF